MQKTIVDNEFLTIYSDKEASLVTQIYKKVPDDLEFTQELYKECMLILAKEIQEEKLTKNFVDGRFSEIVLTPEIQKWMANVISPMTSCLEKIAFIVSEDLFTHVSNSQMMNEEGIKDKYQIKYFDSVDQAKDWLDIA